jgi:DNA-binding beta-propeller fold protein YncE
MNLRRPGTFRAAWSVVCLTSSCASRETTAEADSLGGRGGDVSEASTDDMGGERSRGRDGAADAAERAAQRDGDTSTTTTRDGSAPKLDGGAIEASLPTHDASRLHDASALDGAKTADSVMDGQIIAHPATLRDVLLVGNSVSGTVSFLDARTFASLGSVDVIPDLREVLAEIQADLVRSVAYPIIKSQQLIHHFEPSAGDRFVDDLFLSPDGTTLYVSRSNLGDVAAFDLTRKGHPLRWKTRVDGLKADHASISPDGKRLVVSATTAQVADVFDAESGKLIGSFQTGYYPHQNDYSADGKHIYNSSIGNVGYEAVPYELNALKGDRWLVKADAVTLEVVHTWHFEYGIRPSVITADEKIMYAQLSYVNGVIKYDLEQEREVARSEQPLSTFALETYKTYTEYPHDSAHHGLSLSGDGKKLCDCGTIDNQVAIVSTDSMKATKLIEVGAVPYWATTLPDGQHCAVSLSGANAVAIIDFESETQIAESPVGKFPQRSRLGKIPAQVVDTLNQGEK